MNRFIIDFSLHPKAILSRYSTAANPQRHDHGCELENRVGVWGVQFHNEPER
jgi:hypothetical protein